MTSTTITRPAEEYPDCTGSQLLVVHIKSTAIWNYSVVGLDNEITTISCNVSHARITFNCDIATFSVSGIIRRSFYSFSIHSYVIDTIAIWSYR